MRLFGFFRRQPVPVIEPEVLSPAQHFWLRTFLIWSAICFTLQVLRLLSELPFVLFRPRQTFIDAYLVLLQGYALSAELRQYSLLRRVSYVWMKYFYLLTSYQARGLLYVMCGTLTLSETLIQDILACAICALGLLMLLVSCVMTLPRFVDPEEEEQEALDAYESADAENGRYSEVHNSLLTTP